MKLHEFRWILEFPRNISPFRPFNLPSLFWLQYSAFKPLWENLGPWIFLVWWSTAGPTRPWIPRHANSDLSKIQFFQYAALILSDWISALYIRIKWNYNSMIFLIYFRQIFISWNGEPKRTKFSVWTSEESISGSCLRLKYTWVKV